MDGRDKKMFLLAENLAVYKLKAPPHIGWTLIQTENIIYVQQNMHIFVKHNLKNRDKIDKAVKSDFQGPVKNIKLLFRLVLLCCNNTNTL